MKPSEFLDKALKHSPEHWKHSSTRTAINELKDKMEKCIPIDPLFLDIDTVNCKVTNHEGRHRALAAEEAGISRVPVIIYLMDNNNNRISAREYMKQITTDNKMSTGTKTINKCNYFDAQKQETLWG